MSTRNVWCGNVRKLLPVFCLMADEVLAGCGNVRKLLPVLCVIAAVTLTGCGKSSEVVSEIPVSEEAEDCGYVHLRVSYLVASEIPEGLSDVQERVNEIARKQLGVEIELVPVMMESASSVYAQRIAGGDALDLMILNPGSSNIPYLADNNMIAPLDDAMEYAAYMVRFMGEDLDAGIYQGKQYGIPQETTELKREAKGFYLSRKLCQEYGIDISEIASVEDLEETFAMVHEADPEQTILMPETSGTIADSLIPYYDNLSIGQGILLANKTGYCVQSLTYEPAVEDALRRVYGWYQAGYIPRNVNNTDQNGVDMVKAGICFAAAVTDIGSLSQDRNGYYLSFQEELPLVTTDTITSYEWVVSSQCSHPEKAVAFLNMCFKDSRVSNLLRFGILNEHYNIDEYGRLNTDYGVDFNNSLIQFGDPSQICVTSQVIEAATLSEGISLPTLLRKLNGYWQVAYSDAYGFTFDPAAVLLEISACNEIDDKYYAALFNGVVNPETELPKYRQELVNAGMNRICSEKERQLTEWLESREE